MEVGWLFKMFDRNDKQRIVKMTLMTTLIEMVGGLKFLEIVIT